MRYSQNQNTNLMDYSMIRYLWLHKIDKNEDFEQMTAFLEPNYTIPSRQLLIMVSWFTRNVCMLFNISSHRFSLIQQLNLIFVYLVKVR